MRWPVGAGLQGGGQAGPVTAGGRGTATCASRAVGGGRREVDGGRAGGGPAGRPTRRRAGGCLGARFLREREPRPDSTALTTQGFPGLAPGDLPASSSPAQRAPPAGVGRGPHGAWSAPPGVTVTCRRLARRLPPRPAEAACAQVAGCSRRHDAARPGRSLETQFSPLCSFRNR